MSLPPVETQAAPASQRRAKRPGSHRPHDPEWALKTLEKHVLLDGFRIVVDLERSHGSYMFDAASGHRLIDFYGFFGSMAVGFNHPHFDDPSVQAELFAAARIKVANSDIYSEAYAEFVDTFTQVAGLPPLGRYLFIEGGALAIENCLKAAMDWKVRKNMAAALGERGTEVLHFRRAFHGRSGYTMSLTNTDPRKTDLFAKFPWPRVSCPCVDFTFPPAERERAAIVAENECEREIRDFIKDRGADICAIIIEPIQGEGGDNHFRGEWLRKLREMCDEHDLLLIFDEVQTGLGTTGKMWASQHFDVKPDLMAFGKKVQVCGVMAGPRLDEVKENAFRLPSRLNSTWGGNFTDMVRSKHYLRIIESENLVENARTMGERILQALHNIAAEFPMITAVRGRGLFIAFDMPDAETRDEFWRELFDAGLLVLKSGEHSIRFRPALDISAEAADEAMGILRKQAAKIARR